MSKSILLLLLVLITAFPICSEAKLYYYLVTPSDITKFDADTDDVVNVIEPVTNILGYLNPTNNECVLDPKNDQLVTLSNSSQPGLLVYKISDLAAPKLVGFPNYIKNIISARIIYPSASKYYYVQLDDNSIYNDKVIGEITFKYEKVTHKLVGTVPNFMENGATEKLWYSKAGDRIYVASEDKLKIFDATTESLTSQVDLVAVFSSGIFGKELSDIRDDLLLLSESVAIPQTEKRRYYLYSYNLTTKERSKYFELTGVGDAGETTLVAPDKALVNEVNIGATYTVFGPANSIDSPSRVLLYNLKTGSLVGNTPSGVTFGGKVLGVHPDGTKLYYFLPTATEVETNTISIIDLKTFETIDAISTEDLGFIIFSEESQ